MMIDVGKQGPVIVLTMDDGENRMSAAWLEELVAALDAVEAVDGPKALVTTGTGKFYSNGLDLDWLRSGRVDMAPFVAGVERVFARILGLPLITVAACNGHTFAAGAMLAMAHDFRIMRADRGFFCLPEVDIKIPLTPGMNALMTARLPTVTAHEVLVTGKRFGGVEAAEKQIVDRAVAEGDVLSEAVAMARELSSKAGPTLGAIKQRLYATAISLLEASEGTSLPISNGD